MSRLKLQSTQEILIHRFSATRRIFAIHFLHNMLAKRFLACEGRVWMQCILQAWCLMATRSHLAAADAEIDRLREKLGRTGSSIWNMLKEELIEVAVNELGVTRPRAAKMNVPELRERIRAARQPPEPEDPLVKPPPNLSNLDLGKLRAECSLRGLEPDEQATRGQMIVLIQDDIQYRKSLEAPGSSTLDPTTTEWFEMDVDSTEMHPARPRRSMTGSESSMPKAKAKTKAKGRGRGV